MPWTADSFRAKHDKGLTKSQSARAAKMANAILRSGGDEGVAIATAIKHVKSSTASKLYGKGK